MRRSVVLIALLSACSRNNEGVARQKPDGPPVGHWQQLPRGPTGGTASGHTFTDHDYFAWGVDSGDVAYPAGTPFMFDASTFAWRTGSMNMALFAGWYSSATWTGTEVIIWGGEDNNNLATTADAGAYNVNMDSWRAISRVGAPSPREYTKPVWTGTEMIIWGGGDTRTNGTNPPVLGDGYGYNPTTDLWRTISNVGAPSARLNAFYAWAGNAMLVWGGTADTNTIRARQSQPEVSSLGCSIQSQHGHLESHVHGQRTNPTRCNRVRLDRKRIPRMGFYVRRRRRVRPVNGFMAQHRRTRPLCKTGFHVPLGPARTSWCVATK